MLLGLRSVDAVVVFDEDDPRAVLDRLRPDVWAKGGDYDASCPARAGARPQLGRPGRAAALPGRPVHHRDPEHHVMRGQAAWATERELGTVYVTGGASGLGAAVVEAVSKAGGTPAVIDLVAPAPGVAHVEADLSDSRAAAAAVERSSPRSGRRRRSSPPPAPTPAAPLADVPVEAWERVVAVNLLGTAAVVRAALPHLRARSGTRGHRRLDPGPARRRRRHGLLRVQVRRRRLHPGPGDGAGRRGRRHAAGPRRA